MQSWPELQKLAMRRPSATARGSASSKMIDRRLAAELEVHALERVRRAAGDALAGADAAGQRDQRDLGMADDRLAHAGTVAGDDVEHARRQDVGDQLGEPQRRDRRQLGRLEHHDVARRQRRADLPDRHHQRVVPRRDLADDAQRLAPDQRRVALAVLAGQRAVQRARRAGEEAQLVGAHRHLLGGQRVRLADVDRLERGELLDVVVDDVGHGQEQLLAAAGRRVAERDPGGARGGDRALDVGARPLGHARDDLARGRVEDVAGRAVDAVDQLAADQVAELADRGGAHFTPPRRRSGGPCGPRRPSARRRCRRRCRRAAACR